MALRAAKPVPGYKYSQPGTGFAAEGYPDASFHGAVFG
jgi:hypothetical protein